MHHKKTVLNKPRAIYQNIHEVIFSGELKYIILSVFGPDMDMTLKTTIGIQNGFESKRR